MAFELSPLDRNKKEILLAEFPHLGTDFTKLVNECYDLKIDPRLYNYSSLPVEIIKDFLLRQSKYLNNVIDAYGRYSSESFACAELIVDISVLGIDIYCLHIVNATDKIKLAEFLNKTDALNQIDFCNKTRKFLINNYLLSREIRKNYYKTDTDTLLRDAMVIVLNKDNYLSKKPKEGCYIATMVYGSYEANEVIQLRALRDNVLQSTLPGRIFIKFYYIISPYLVRHLEQFDVFHRICKYLLERIFYLKSINHQDNISLKS